MNEGAAGVSDKSNAGDDRGIPPFKKRRVGHPAVTGKGLSDLIREEFGLRITFLMMLGILITNFGNVIAEFAGIAGSMELFGVSKYISVPICAVIVWLIVVKGQYKSVEKVFLAASFFYVTYIVAGVWAKPAWIEALAATVNRSL